jgi:hypothetical protein
MSRSSRGYIRVKSLQELVVFYGGINGGPKCFALERVAVGQGSLERFHGLSQRDLSDWGVSRL